jgi:hypothetical protein
MDNRLSAGFFLTIALRYSCLGFLIGWLSASWRASAAQPALMDLEATRQMA